MSQTVITEEVRQKWEPVLSTLTEDKVELSKEMEGSVLTILENTAREVLSEDNVTADIATYTPVLISMLTRMLPSLVGTRLVGLQPMRAPTQQIFAMYRRYGNAAGAEAFGATAPDPNYSGGGTGQGMTAAQAEALGVQKVVDATSTNTAEPVTQANPWAEMAIDIDDITVTARSRALKATFTREMEQDLRAVHGKNAEQILRQMLHSQVTAEIDRELFNFVQNQAVKPNVGAGGNVLDFPTDVDGRWSVEQYKALMFIISKQANAVGRETRMGTGNIVVASPDVAAALQMATTIDTSNRFGNLSPVDVVSGLSYVGVLGGRFQLLVDPYAASDFVTVAFKGDEFTAGAFYCPYTPAEFVRASGEDDLTRKRIGIKTRYGLVHNHLVNPTGAAGGNPFYRTFTITNMP